MAVAGACAASAGSALAAPPGTFDPSFGSGGAVVKQFGAGSQPSTSVAAMARQPDGKLVIVGQTTYLGGPDASSVEHEMMVVRLNQDGSLDPNFQNARNMFDLGSSLSTKATAVALEPDGKIVIAGELQATTTASVLLVRLNPDGSVDGSFNRRSGCNLQAGGGSKVSEHSTGVAVQADGKIVLVGRSANFNQPPPTGDQQVMVQRLNADGSPDASFANGSCFLHQFGQSAGPFSDGRAVALQSDGKIVIAGGATDAGGTNDQLLVARLNANGTLDGGYGSGGAALTQLGAGSQPDSAANSIALQADGETVFAGTASDDAGHDASLVGRLTLAGDLDPSFAGSGFSRQQFGAGSSPSSDASSVAIQPDGSIVVGGSATDSADIGQLLVVRLGSGGSLDSTFGSGGVVRGFSPNGGSNPTVSQSVAKLVLQPDGKIVTAGTAADLSNQAVLFVTRLLGDPAPVATFSSKPAHARLHAPVAFNAGGSSAHTAITSYSWSFGDGGRATGERPSHTFRHSGSYKVTLTITDSNGLIGTAAHVIGAGRPRLAHVRESRKRWRRDNRLPHISRARGTKFSFTLNQAARVTFTFKKGRHVRWKLKFDGRLGRNAVVFGGRLNRRHRLAPGAYTLVITAIAGRERSRPVRLKFTILS